MLMTEQPKRKPYPTDLTDLDSQSVKTTAVPGVRGYDAAKKFKGRKRHILVDTIGLLLMVLVHAASSFWGGLAISRQCINRSGLFAAELGSTSHRQVAASAERKHRCRARPGTCPARLHSCATSPESTTRYLISPSP